MTRQIRPNVPTMQRGRVACDGITSAGDWWTIEIGECCLPYAGYQDKLPDCLSALAEVLIN